MYQKVFQSASGGGGSAIDFTEYDTYYIRDDSSTGGSIVYNKSGLEDGNYTSRRIVGTSYTDSNLSLVHSYPGGNYYITTVTFNRNCDILVWNFGYDVSARTDGFVPKSVNSGESIVVQYSSSSSTSQGMTVMVKR